MYNSVDERIFLAKKYTEELGWWLVPVRGVGIAPKAPLVDGWVDWKPDTEAITEILESHPCAGIGVHLDGSRLVDLEGDSDEGEAILTDLCRGLDFPCWRSRRSTHRLFQAHPDITYLNIKSVGVEFRAGRHQSVLPPTIFRDGGVNYKWLVSPFDLAPPPLPEHVVQFYRDHAAEAEPRTERTSVPGDTKSRFPYRDNLDYLLRHFDLLEKVEAAGLELLCHYPDGNGNVPCYVPAVLRGGNEDQHPSGIFNDRNGILRDFATGRNHRYFGLLEALTRVPWLDIYRRYEAQAGPISGRPHSRRISLPIASQAGTERVDLQTARQLLGEYLDEQLRRPPIPGTLHLIKGQCGVGKTYTICKKLAQRGTKAVILTLENELASNHLQIINEEPTGNARRMPVLRNTACPHPDEYDATVRRGYKPSQTYPCLECPITTKNCPYLLGFQDVTSADQLCCAAVYHCHDDFHASYGNQDRGVLVFDESCVDLILAPHAASINQWRAWGNLIQNWPKPGVQREHAQRLLAFVNWLDLTATEFLQTGEKFKPYAIPAGLHTSKLEKSGALIEWLHREPRQCPNLYEDAIYLLTKAGAAIIMENIQGVANVRFRRKHPLPQDKEIFILDATANEELIRAMAPGWTVKVWECPPIEQRGTVIQIMDYDVSRNRIKKEVERHRDSNPCWLVQVMDHILDKVGTAPIITFKKCTENPKQENDILSLLKNRDRLGERFNYPCRGYNIDSPTLIVMGTPYKDHAVVLELAMAIYGLEGLPTSKYERRDREVGDFIAGNMSYAEPQVAPIIDFVVSAELSQAVGRIRPLQNECTAYVISNAPIQDWEVQQVCASELFDMRQVLRKDARDNYQRYVDVTQELLGRQKWVKNSDVCKLAAIPERSGRNYWSRYKDDYQDRILVQGPRMKLKTMGDDYKPLHL